MRGRHRIYHDRSAYESIQKRLAALGRVENPRALARDISKALYEGNRYDRFREVDRFGKPLIPWRVRRGKYKGALGPTLIPHGTGSDAIRGFFVQRTDLSDGWRLTAGIRSTKEYIYGFHAEGKAGTGSHGGGGIGKGVNLQACGERPGQGCLPGPAAQAS